MTPAHALIIDATRAGVLLIPDGNRLRFKALRAIPGDLAERLRANRADVLALLDARHDPTCPRNRTSAALRLARGRDRCKAVALRDAWRERLAICTADSGLTVQQAEIVAADEITLQLAISQASR
jgi:hypothetical protein